MRPKQRPAAGGGAFPDARGRRGPTARLSSHPAPLTFTGCGASPMRRADPSHLAGGANHLCTPSRADPLASAGRSAFTLRGSEPPRQLRPALVCLRRDPLLLCEANRPAFGSLRRGSADPLRHVWLTTCCAGQPLAAAGPEESIFKAISPPAAPGGPRAWGAPAMPGCPARAAGDNSHALPALGPPAVRLPASRPSQTHLPGARASLPARAAHRLPADADKARRPIRLDLRPRSPPSVSPFEIPLPAAAQRQGPLDRQWRFSSRAPKSDSPPQ